MASLTSIFWIIGFALSVILAPQLRIWTWGPGMIFFALAAITAIPLIWREQRNRTDTVIIALAFLIAGWIGIRAITSPVIELALSDLLLLAMAVSTFVSMRAISRSLVAERIFIGGIALLLLASVWIIWKQYTEPGFSPLYPSRKESLPAGFFGHYSYGATFLIGVAMFTAAAAIHSREKALVKIILGIISIAAVIAIVYTRSRGGILGIASGLAVLSLFSLFVWKRESNKLFGIGIIAIPILGAVGSFFLYHALSDALETRGIDADMVGMMDNSIRLYLFGIAFSCIALHPLLGGGSRSYSWECFHFWDVKAMGLGSNKPEHVHNELIQTATDYGIIGAVLLTIFVLAILVQATLSSFSGNSKNLSTYSDAWCIGGIAAFAGLFAQSNFEGIFRIPPGAILLALSLSAAALRLQSKPNQTGRPWFHASLITLFTITSAALLAFWGFKGSQVSSKLWKPFFGKIPVGTETKIHHLSDALDIWPLASLYQQRAILQQGLSAETNDPETSKLHLSLALADYKIAAELHPFDPGHAVSNANLLSSIGDDASAEAEYIRAINLQGGMETAFMSNYMFASHLLRKGLRDHDKDDPFPSLETFQLAAIHIEKAAELTLDRLFNPESRLLRVSIHESLGAVLEALGEYDEAMEKYDYAATLRDGSSAHYRAALLLGKSALRAWSERRPGDALRHFIDARDRALIVRILPSGVTPQQRTEFIEYLRNQVKFLEGAKISPPDKADL